MLAQALARRQHRVMIAAGTIIRHLGGLAGRLGRELWAFSTPQGLLAALLAERERWVLWLPVCLGAGIALYFAWPWPVAPKPLTWMAGLCLPGLAWLFRRHPGWAAAALPTWLMLFGFALVASRADTLAAPVLERRMPAAMLEGRLVLVEPRDNGHRLTIADPRIERLAPEQTPRRVRVTLRQNGEAGGETLLAGQMVRLRAVLAPPPEPSMPGAYDFARAAWFQQLGAVGNALGVVEVLAEAPPEGVWQRAALWLEATRQSLTARILAPIGGAEGAIAAALMTGVRGPIPEDVDDAFRDSGLAHILSISGLHLVLVGGILFASLRGLMALWPWLALHWPVKKIAAIAALIGTAAYMLLSGSALPTQRAFVMVAFGFCAILLDRRAISPRSLALAALFMLLWAPESLLDAGFQMSFAAVACLIAAYEALEARLTRLRSQAGPVKIALLWIGGAMLTSLVAGFGSGLFAAYHFNRFADYALVANLLASPLVSFIVMPLTMAAFALMPLGLEALALIPLGWSIDLLIDLAVWVAGWPGAVAMIPAMPGWALPAIGFGLAWLCLWRRGWRWLGLAPIMLALAMPFIQPRPDLLISSDAGRIALRGLEPDRYHFSSGGARVPPTAFEAESWWRRLGGPELSPWPNVRRGQHGSADGVLRCDDGGCTARLKGWLIAIPRSEATAEADCRHADIVLTNFPLRGRCAAARIVVDRFDVWRRGAHAVYLPERNAGWPRVVTVADERGRKPWVKSISTREASPRRSRPDNNRADQ